MEEKVSSTLSGLEGELKGQFYPLTGMTKEVQQKLIDDHFLFKEGDRFLQVGNQSQQIDSAVSWMESDSAGLSTKYKHNFVQNCTTWTCICYCVITVLH